MTSIPSSPKTRSGSPVIRLSVDDKVMRLLLVLLFAFLAVSVFMPIYSLLSRSVRDSDGNFVGLDNFSRFFGESGLAAAAWNSVFIATLSTIITVVVAFGFAYSFARSRIPFKPVFRGAAMIPLLAPSLLPAIALIYLFGQKGFASQLLLGHSIYGPIGIVLGEVIFSLPQAILILTAALSTADQRLYDAATTLRAKPLRIFMQVTLPGCRYGLISTAMAVFVRVFTDFGVPVVIGGSYPVLATEIYKQVVGRYDFEMGAVVGIFLLIPALISIVVDRAMRRHQQAMVSARAVPLVIGVDRIRDAVCFVLCAAVSLVIFGIICVAIFGSLVKYWPYNLSLTLDNYNFQDVDNTGVQVYVNSLTLSFYTALFGSIIIFMGAYLIEKMKGLEQLKMLTQLMCVVPLAVPGLVLGLSYIFFFNNPSNPLHFIYGTMTILVLSTITHFYTVPHMIATVALKQIDREFEVVAASLRVPFHHVLRRVTLPICLPAITDIWGYLFVNSMTTVSVVIFLYPASTRLASITVVQWNDSGKIATAAAMAVTIFATSAVVMGLKALVNRLIFANSQVWRRGLSG